MAVRHPQDFVKSNRETKCKHLKTELMILKTIEDSTKYISIVWTRYRKTFAFMQTKTCEVNQRKRKKGYNLTILNWRKQ